jgi:hypothetical protein
VALGAELTGKPQLARAKTAAAGAAALSLAALIKDLGRPARFLNMVRVFMPTSPLSVGTWILSAGRQREDLCVLYRKRSVRLPERSRASAWAP